MNDIKGCCAHLTIKWMTTTDKNQLTHGWWECTDCRCSFCPTVLAKVMQDDFENHKEKLEGIYWERVENVKRRYEAIERERDYLLSLITDRINLQPTISFMIKEGESNK